MHSFNKQSTMNNQKEILFMNSNWLKKRFLKNRLNCKTSRYLIAISINYLLKRDERRLCKQNENISQSIEDIKQHIEVLEEKVHTLNDLCHFLQIPLNIYFEQRMARLRHSAEQYMIAIEQEIRDEIEHWHDIHSFLSQPLLEPGLFRSYHSGLPQQIQQSPASEIDTIYEENETIELSETKSIRYLTPINTFSILSNRIHPQDSSTNKLNKTFIKLQSATDDENFISTKSLNTFSIDKNLSDSELDDTIIYIE